MVVIGLVLQAVTIALMLPTSWGYADFLTNVMIDGHNAQAALDSFLADYGLLLAVGIAASAVLSPILTGAVLLATGRACLGQATKLGPALGQSLRRWPALFVQALISGAPGMVAGGLALYGGWRIISSPAWQWFSQSGSAFSDQPGFEPGQLQSALAAGAVFILLSLLVLVADAFWLVSMAMAPAVIMLEGTGAVAGIRRSWRLLRGGFGRVLGRWLLATLIVFGASFAAGIFALIPLMGLVVSAAIGALAGPWFYAICALLYIDRRISEGDFAAHIMAAVEVTPDPPMPPYWGGAANPQWGTPM